MPVGDIPIELGLKPIGATDGSIMPGTIGGIWAARGAPIAGGLVGAALASGACGATRLRPPLLGMMPIELGLKVMGAADADSALLADEATCSAATLAISSSKTG